MPEFDYANVNDPDGFFGRLDDPENAAVFSRYLQIRGGKAAQEAVINDELAERQFARDFAMWKEQNAYNDPSAQMQRLIDAGATPASAMQAVLGGMQPSQFSASSAPSASGSDFGQDVANLAGSVGSLSGGFSSIMEGIGTLIDNNTRGAKNQLQLREINANIDKIGSEISLNYWQQKKFAKDIWRIEKLTPVEVSKGRQEIINLQKEVEKMDAEIRDINSSADLKDVQQDFYSQEARKSKYEALIEKWRYATITVLGFDPHSSLVMAGIQAITSGKGASFLQALGNTISSMLPEIPDVITDILGLGEDGGGLKGLLSNANESLGDPLGGAKNLFSAILMQLMLHGKFQGF